MLEKTEKELMDEMFLNVLDSAPVMIWVTDPERVAYFFNNSWLAFTGRTLADEYGNGWLAGVHPEDVDRVIHLSASSVKKRIPATLEYRIRRHDGQYRWVQVSATPRHTREGTFLGYLGSAVDIHDLKALDQLKDEFISVASHELKTPLTTLGASIQLLQRIYSKNPVSPQVPHLINNSVMALGKLMRLSDDLLNASVLREGKVQLSRSAFNLFDLVTETCANFKQTAKNEVIILGDEQAEVHADRLKIDQVIVNFVTNAIKFSPDGTPVVVEVSSSEDQVVVTVTDTGLGIPKEKQPYIFDRYNRAGIASTQISGIGLGLYISSEIINAHQGSIGVKSTPGKGSSFWFILPR